MKALARPLAKTSVLGRRSSGRFDPSLLWKFDFRSYSLDGAFTFTRSSVATDVIEGVLRQFSSNAPRVSSSNGILIEDSRTNLAQNGSLANNVGCTTSNVTDLLGGSQAILASEDSSTGAHVVGPPNVTPTASAVYSASCFVKAGTISRVQLSVASTYAATDVYANFLLSGAGSVSAQGAGASNVRITALSGGWYRVFMTFTASGTPTAGAGPMVASLRVGDETRQPSLVGSTSNNFYYWGAQLEAGAFASSYIPTAGASATRAADNCTCSLTGLDAVRTVVGELKVVTNTDAVAVAGQRPFQLDDGSISNRLFVSLAQSNGELRSSTTVGGTGVGLPGSGVMTAAGSSYKFASVHNTNDFRVYANGSTGVPDTTGALPSGLTTLRVGHASGAGGAMCGYIRYLKMYGDVFDATRAAAATA